MHETHALLNRVSTAMRQLDDLADDTPPPRWDWSIVAVEKTGRISLPCPARAALGLSGASAADRRHRSRRPAPGRVGSPEHGPQRGDTGLRRRATPITEPGDRQTPVRPVGSGSGVGRRRADPGQLGRGTPEADTGPEPSTGVERYRVGRADRRRPHDEHRPPPRPAPGSRRTTPNASSPCRRPRCD